MPACPVGSAYHTGAVTFFSCLDHEQKSSFMDEQELTLNRAIIMPIKIGCWLLVTGCQLLDKTA
jgi:hypothetical protein